MSWSQIVKGQSFLFQVLSIPVLILQKNPLDRTQLQSIWTQGTWIRKWPLWSLSDRKKSTSEIPWANLQMDTFELHINKLMLI